MEASVRAPSGQEGQHDRGRNLAKEVKLIQLNNKTQPGSPMKKAARRRADSNKANAGGEGNPLAGRDAVPVENNAFK